MRRWLVASAVIASALRLVACGSFSGSSDGSGAATDADANGIDTDADAAHADAAPTDAASNDSALATSDGGGHCSPADPFGSVTTLSGFAQRKYPSNVRLTADELTLFFQANVNPDYDVFTSTRPDFASAWSTPASVANVDIVGVTEGSPSPSPDGLELFFEDNRNTLGQGVWLATRPEAGAPWNVPSAPLAQTTSVNEGQPFFDPVQQRLYFISNSSMRSGLVGMYDVIQGDYANGKLSNVKSVPGINSTADDSHPTLSADALAIYFVSSRGGTPQVWVATRTTTADGFGDPAISSSFNGVMVPSWFSVDGCRVYGHRPTNEASTDYELVMASRPLH